MEESTPRRHYFPSREWQEEIAKKARENGFIFFAGLPDFMALEDQYSENDLIALWENNCNVGDIREIRAFRFYWSKTGRNGGFAEIPELSALQLRLKLWNDLFFRWGLNLFPGFKEDLWGIDCLPLENKHGERIRLDQPGGWREVYAQKPRVKLHDLQNYFAKRCIPLPSLIFPDPVKDVAKSGSKALDDPNPREKEEAPRTIIPCRPGTRWEDIHITAISNQSVKIGTPEGEERLTYGKMGFSDGRNPDQPTRLWKLLLAFCANQGGLSDSDLDDFKNPYKDVSDLDNRLQESFGIERSFLLDKGSRKKLWELRKKLFFDKERPQMERYISAIKFSDKRAVTDPYQNKANSRDDDLLECMAEDIGRGNR
jgi:hypothetical protein